MIEIIPAILTKTFDEFEKMVRRVEPFVERVALDIADESFTPSSTIKGHEELLKIETPVKFDVHLMIVHPSEEMYCWYKTKADRFFIHAENNSNLGELINQIHMNHRKVGLVLNPENTS